MMKENKSSLLRYLGAKSNRGEEEEDEVVDGEEVPFYTRVEGESKE